MFDIAPSEMLLIATVALVAIGPKDMPQALRVAGRTIGKARRISQHLRSGFEAMLREAELNEVHPQAADTTLAGVKTRSVMEACPADKPSALGIPAKAGASPTAATEMAPPSPSRNMAEAG